MMMMGVEVGWGVGVGRGVSVGAGVQVGRIRMRGVALGGISVGGAVVVEVAVGVGEQPARIKTKQRENKKIRCMVNLPCVCGSTPHSYPAPRQVSG